MGHYFYRDDKFVIQDYQKQKTFASFLPAIAGQDGKPLWAFYANVGQAMGGFGVTSKDTPITPFDSANLAYGNIPVKGFRTLAKINGKFFQPFFDRDGSYREMEVSRYDVSVLERNPYFEMKATYFGVPHQTYSALVRRVEIKNISKQDIELELLDGLPIFFPHGLSNFCYKELVSLMAAYCEVHQLESNTPFVKFKTSTADHAAVEEALEGNGYFAIDQDDKHLDCIVDPTLVFEEDFSQIYPDGFQKNELADLLKAKQQTENKLPCAFYGFKRVLKAGETYSYFAVFGNWGSEEAYLQSVKDLTTENLKSLQIANKNLIESLLEPATTKTGYPLFDECLKQSYLDNNLRGGFPTLLGKDQVYYLYGRKHGDMERDYNAFNIPARYYSSGPGNFRDVNQNRRNDLFFAPFVKDYNIKTFFSLIQIDGQNPLNVRPNSFKGGKDAIKAVPAKYIKDQARLEKVLERFDPAMLYTLFVDEWGVEKKEAERILNDVLNASSQQVEANFGEGYWVDHWTYNVDLLESYSSIYPDQEEELLFNDSYGYFYSPVFVEPRSEKYCLIEEGKIRQYGAVDLKALKERCEREGLDISKTDWLKDENGKVIKTTLANKIVQLVLVKFSTLDSLQMGIEMECEKPGWNDAMNGLPGLFGSGLSETVELLRLLRYGQKHLAPFKERTLQLMEGQYEFFKGLEEATNELCNGTLSRFAYWDKATSLRETLRARYRRNGESSVKEVEIAEILKVLGVMESILVDGIKRAKVAGKGILPSYLIYRLSSYEVTDHVNHLGYRTVKPLEFTLETIPPFLEASARALKCGNEFLDDADLDAIKASRLYDEKLHFYKTCADIDDAPFEIGRVHAFTKGWLERECNFLHMDYKFMLGLLKGGFLTRFYDELPTNWVLHYDPEIYGRNPAEASSFVVPTCNLDTAKHGRGYFARLTGANAEFLNMFVLLFAGEKLFKVEQGELVFELHPVLSSKFFDENNEACFVLFGKTKVTYKNPRRIDLKGNEKLSYVIDGKRYDVVKGDVAKAIREGSVGSIVVEVL